MFTLRTTWVAAFALGLGCLLLPGLDVGAGDKKEEKKKSTAKAPPFEINGELKDGDPNDTKFGDRPGLPFKTTLTKDKTYQIDLKSTDFDSFLRLEFKGKEVAFDDDGGGFPDAQLKYKAKETGEYTIIVTSFDKKVGKFNLKAAEAQKAEKAVGNSRFQGKGVELKLKDGKASTPAPLNDKDPVFAGHRFKVFTVQLEKEKTYRIVQMDGGDNARGFVFLEDANGNSLDQSDPGAKESRIIVKAVKTATYRIVTTTATPKVTGAFVLEISPETDAKLLTEADLRYRINTLGTVTKAKQKALADEVAKRLNDADGDLTIADAKIVIQLAMEAETEDVELARLVYKDGIKYFSAAKDEKVAGISRQFEMMSKSLEKVGKTIDIAGMTLKGKEFDLKNLKGKVVLVDFWGTWCGPCVAEIPNMVNAYEKYNKRGFEIIGVAQDKDDETVLNFMDGRSLPWACINIEDSRKLIQANNVNSYPTPILVDQAGRIVSMRARGPQLERLLERLLPEKK